jgi:hypothetical protein
VHYGAAATVHVLLRDDLPDSAAEGIQLMVMIESM